MIRHSLLLALKFKKTLFLRHNLLLRAPFEKHIKKTTPLTVGAQGTGISTKNVVEQNTEKNIHDHGLYTTLPNHLVDGIIEHVPELCPALLDVFETTTKCFLHPQTHIQSLLRRLFRLPAYNGSRTGSFLVNKLTSSSNCLRSLFIF